MYTLSTRNVNSAVSWGLDYLLRAGIEEPSRNGKVLVAPGPVMTIYNEPRERVLFSPLRDANPFFHLMESLWMLSGRNDIAFPVQFNKRFAEYSDDGKTAWGAYGWRWREFFGYDQLASIVDELRRNPASRRCVLAMWNAMPKSTGESIYDYQTDHDDLHIARSGGKDVPCNTHAYFDCRGGKLNMTVCTRSNDAIWGAYGANAVHFSILQEYMAEQVGVPMGLYRQMSNNFHAYLDVYSREKIAAIADEAGKTNMYNVWPALTNPYPLSSTDENFVIDLELFLDKAQVDYSRKTFFSQIAGPMHGAWFARKNGRPDVAATLLATMPDCDWRFAAIEWMKRRIKGESNAA